MEISRNIEIVDKYPALYLKDIDTLVVSDMHLGLEGIAAEQGIYIPKIQFEKELNALKNIMQKVSAENIVICGDIKHEFSETSYHEFREVSDIFTFLKEKFKRVILIKGNHDNFIIYVTRRHGVELYEDLLIDRYYFLHGHKIPEDFHKKIEEAEYIIMGHEHPAIALFDDVGIKEKVKVFLYGYCEALKKKIIVLPAFSVLAQGSEINVIPKEELLSPILKMCDIDKFKVISADELVLDFGFIENLRLMNSRI